MGIMCFVVAYLKSSPGGLTSDISKSRLKKLKKKERRQSQDSNITEEKRVTRSGSSAQ